ncbi:type IV secretory system conjugative DNA transfer family protein [Butyrivibrio sp. WCD3002]|uniref:type IV secretory system conjugative DNA transfer family protein n=1 Tax=Butyrivibrio sp. WCD3002 TaxID=1280676 RepID=UPI0009DC2E25|nr:type IV secretory system conjugative DNA transfer family protein [Butyrivibrio sp. WCD3002]
MEFPQIDLKKILINIGVAILAIFVLGAMTGVILASLNDWSAMGSFEVVITPQSLFGKEQMFYGIVEFGLLGGMYVVYKLSLTYNSQTRLLKGKNAGPDRIEGSLENSRWMNEKERNELFPHKTFHKLSELKKDGIPLYAVYNPRKRDMDINIISPAHGIIIGATGSGKTTTFVNPVIQVLGHSAAGSSMICTDPKGELFQMHSKLLNERGYNCMVLDLRDPYSSFRWNPLGDIYDNFQRYCNLGSEILEHTDSISEYPDLKRMHSDEAFEEAEDWYEWDGCAWAVGMDLINKIRMEKQKIYDECYEDLNDLVSVICPIENEKDPVWEKGARSIIMAVCLAMLEDSADPKLEMTKDKFCFYNVNKAISNSENEYAALKDYFQGRDKLSKAAGLSKQVLGAADQTLASYMSIALDKLSMFNDEGLCALTSATDIKPSTFADQPTALFLKIPDEKDTRHALAAVFILCIYKALIKVASATEELSLPRNVFFILDEFGNMPRIEKFDKMITVGRSRKIWFEMIVQSFAQLKNVYGETIADIVKGNCGIKLFIGSNDIPTCEEFSKMCGNMTVRTTSTSSGIMDKTNNINVSSQTQVRPLIYPSELTRLNNAKSTGNSIVVTFNNFPLMTKFTPSYKCPLYEFGQMDLTEVRNNFFFGDDIYYDLDERNYIVLDMPDEENSEESDDDDYDDDGEGRDERDFDDEEYSEDDEDSEEYEDSDEDEYSEDDEDSEDDEYSDDEEEPEEDEDLSDEEDSEEDEESEDEDLKDDSEESGNV